MLFHNSINAVRQTQVFSHFSTNFTMFDLMGFGFAQIVKKCTPPNELKIQFPVCSSCDLKGLFSDLYTMLNVIFRYTGFA